MKICSPIMRFTVLIAVLAITLAIAGCSAGDSWNEPVYVDSFNIEGVPMLPPSFAELYEVSEAGTAINIAAADTFYKWTTSTAGDMSGPGYALASSDTDTITIGAQGSGTYMVMVAFAFSGSVNTLIEGAIFINDFRQDRLEFNRFLGAGGDQGFAGIMGVVVLSPGDVLDFRVKADGMAKTVAVRHLSFVVSRIGG